jgi:hypothetical protein
MLQNPDTSGRIRVGVGGNEGFPFIIQIIPSNGLYICVLIWLAIMCLRLHVSTVWLLVLHVCLEWLCLWLYADGAGLRGFPMKHHATCMVSCNKCDACVHI